MYYKLNPKTDRNEFMKAERRIKRAFWVFVCAWVGWALLSISILGGLLWVAIHFITKYW